MKKMKTIALLMAALMLVTAFGACAKKEEAKPAEAAAPAGQSDAQYILDKGKLVIGITDYAPMNYYAADGSVTGYDTDVARAICEKLGIEAEFIEINWDSKEIELNSKNIDCIWNGMCITQERRDNMSISNPYMYNTQALVMKADREEEIMASVDGLTLTAEAGSTGEIKATSTDEDDGTEDVKASEYFANANYVPSDSMAKALMEVKSGTADLAILDSTMAFYVVGPGTDFEELVVNSSLNFGQQMFGIAFRKGSDFTAKVDEVMAQLLKDGTLDEIASRYGLQEALIR